MLCSAKHNCSNTVIHQNHTVCNATHACDRTHIDCGTVANCVVEVAHGVQGMVINASMVSDTFKLTCNDKCKDIHVHCNDRVGSSCLCDNCNTNIRYYCYAGGSYCPAYQVQRIVLWKGKVWCKTASNQMYYYYGTNMYCPSVDDMLMGCRSIYASPTYTYSFPPNEACVAVNNTYYSTYSKRWYHNIYTSACRQTLNASAQLYRYYMPTCVEYERGAPPPKQLVCTQNRTRWINKTQWLTMNRTRWINKTRWLTVNQTRWVNKTRFVNETRIINRIRWITKTRWLVFNQTRWVNKTRWLVFNQTRWVNKTRMINQSYAPVISNCTNQSIPSAASSASDQLAWTMDTILYLAGSGLVLLCLFYVFWQCYLKAFLVNACAECLEPVQPYIDCCRDAFADTEEEEEEREIELPQIIVQNGRKQVFI